MNGHGRSHAITEKLPDTIPDRNAACLAACRVPNRGGCASRARPCLLHAWKCGASGAGAVLVESAERVRAMQDDSGGVVM